VFQFDVGAVKKMVSWGSHSIAAPAPACRRTCWRETRPLARYHLAAPGLVARATAFVRVHGDLEAVAADHAAGRMHDDHMAAIRSFRVQGFLHAQRSAVFAPQQAGGGTVAHEAQAQAGFPGGRGGWCSG
jgi:hypothetical protein